MRSARAALALALAVVSGPAAARHNGRDALTALAGTWVGDGVVGLTGATPQQLRCRAVFTPRSLTVTALALHCVSGDFAITAASDITHEGGRFAGTWTETVTGVPGTMAGTARPDRLEGTVSALGVAAALSLTVTGSRQTVSLETRGGFAGRADVRLRRI